MGVWVGASGLVVADVDTKNGKDGFRALATLGLSLTPTFRYPTRTGGEHWIYASSADIGPSSDQCGAIGVDRRAGGSYIIWWADEVPADRSAFSAAAPEWLLEATERVEHSGFTGSIKAWLDILPQGEPTDKVRRFIDDFPRDKFNHEDVVKTVFRLVRLGAEGHTGVHYALDTLYDTWVKPPYDTDDYKREFRTALEGAIRKAGKPQAPVPTLMRAAEVLNEVSSELFEMVTSPAPVDRVAHRRSIMARAYSENLSDSQAMTLVWNSTAGQADQAEMDVEQMWAEVQTARGTEPTATAAKPGAVVASSTRPLLTDEERDFVAGQEWWGTRYLDWVQSKVDYYNAPLHRLGRWAVLSASVGEWGYTAIKGSRPTNVCLYMAAPAPSTVGKTDALGFVATAIDAIRAEEEGGTANLGNLAQITANGLHSALLRRDGKASFVWTDEAQSFLRDIQESKWQGTLLGSLADYYGVGVVGAKQMNNDREFSGVQGKTFLTSYLTGIDDQMADAMDLSMWSSGLFYRFVWAIADPRQRRKKPDQADPTFAGELDPMPRQWAAEFRNARKVNQGLGVGIGRVVLWESDAWDRHYQFTNDIEDAHRDHPRFERIIEPALTRFEKSVIKCATMIALAEASERVTLRHELIAIEQAEEWLASLVTMIDRTSEAKFDRDVQEVYDYCTQQRRSEADVYRAFKPGDKVERILRQLVNEGRIRREGGLVVVV